MQQRIHTLAPVRICDNGGWTDTWFAGHGRVCNIAVLPGVRVQLDQFAREERQHPIVIHTLHDNHRYAPRLEQEGWGRHPLLEAALQALPIPADAAIEITIDAGVPGGAGVGTSASVTVALLAALAQLGPQLSPHQIAMLALRVETELLGWQSGIQDQLAAAHGGISYIEMERYPHASVNTLQPDAATWHALGQQLLLFYLGRPHHSSQVHEAVIRRLEQQGEEETALQQLRQTATASRDAILAGDLKGLGRAMIDNTKAQRRLDENLINKTAHQVMDTARSFGALGWKVNGAGGEGGSVTLLGSNDLVLRRKLLDAVLAINPRIQHIPIQLSRHGVVSWRTTSTL